MYYVYNKKFNKYLFLFFKNPNGRTKIQNPIQSSITVEILKELWFMHNNIH